MMYGNSSNGYSYSPDRSRDVDRFNYSTQGNYRVQGYNYESLDKKGTGHYLGNGQWVED